MNDSHISLHQLFNNFKECRVLVVGDIMTDAYIWGNVNRISPEAPVPVLEPKQKEERPGGAANVALNLVSLGAQVFLAGVTGADDAGQRLTNLLHNLNINTQAIISCNRPTTVKTRLIANNQQMIRIDEEVTADLTTEEENELLQSVENILNTHKIDLIIFEDYNKGVLTEHVIQQIIAWANNRNIVTAVDPKFKNFFLYKNVTLFKPNLKELQKGLGKTIDNKDENSLIKLCAELTNELNCNTILVTLSESGMFVYQNNGSFRIPAHVRNIADVSGAGDTVISIAALCLACKTDIETAVALANLGGGLVCEKVGVVSLTQEQLLQEAQIVFKA